MLQEFDKLGIKANEIGKISEAEMKERIKKRDDLIKKMSQKEIDELLSRNIPGEYKKKIKSLRKQ